MQRETGKQCLLRKAQQIRLESMNILTDAIGHGPLVETKKGPEAELHLGLGEVMLTETGMNPGRRTHVTADTGEADLRQFIQSEGIPRTHLEMKRTNYTSVQSVLLIVFVELPCIPALARSDQRIKSIQEAQTRIHGCRITILPSKLTEELTRKQ